MQLKTKYLGTVEVDPSDCIHFPAGLPGFGDETEFVLLDLPGNPIFQIFQSTKTTAIAFVVTNPHYFYQDYTFTLEDHIVKSLAIEHERDVVVLSIVTLKDPFEKSTLNLQAPVIINSRTKMGRQYILNDDAFPIRAPIATVATQSEKGEA
ncbi:MAG TPA: flagellar assembly protein FliW [Bacillota bacterium]|nr:flagellar assembly protein FliW [Bacillota bacterium]